MFGRLKDFRRVATRYDKNANNFLAALCLAALICYWILMSLDPKTFWLYILIVIAIIMSAFDKAEKARC